MACLATYAATDAVWLLLLDLTYPGSSSQQNDSSASDPDDNEWVSVESRLSNQQ